MKTDEISQLMGISHRVNTDPRVTAAREAIEAFNDSEFGRALEAAIHGPDWKAKMAALSEDVKDTYDAYAINHVITKRVVAREIRGEAPQDYTSIVNHLLGT